MFQGMILTMTRYLGICPSPLADIFGLGRLVAIYAVVKIPSHNVYRSTWATATTIEERIKRTELSELLPVDVKMGWLRMARSMDERCALLQNRIKATLYRDLTDYWGYGFFNSWTTKETGEVGRPLFQPDETRAMWRNALR